MDVLEVQEHQNLVRELVVGLDWWWVDSFEVVEPVVMELELELVGEA
jgi:hypothetical protein